ncbi:hypothetical protein [Asticcacaulis solisilvae]|uniref:hypothetical protein n=1 Tax=Asticcacaulis solisilvae TaxID=1217274 RepID=UPI003FD8647F
MTSLSLQLTALVVLATAHAGISPASAVETGLAAGFSQPHDLVFTLSLHLLAFYMAAATILVVGTAYILFFVVWAWHMVAPSGIIWLTEKRLKDLHDLLSGKAVADVVGRLLRKLVG